VGVLRDVVVEEEQIVGEEAVLAEQAHKQMARDRRTQQQRPPVTAQEKPLHLRRRFLAVGIITPASTAKPLRLAIGRQILRVLQLPQRQGN
jgi:hypothetical protein